jgi:hypothetical protein
MDFAGGKKAQCARTAPCRPSLIGLGIVAFDDKTEKRVRVRMTFESESPRVNALAQTDIGEFATFYHFSRRIGH